MKITVKQAGVLNPKIYSKGFRPCGTEVDYYMVFAITNGGTWSSDGLEAVMHGCGYDVTIQFTKRDVQRKALEPEIVSYLAHIQPGVTGFAMNFISKYFGDK